jgi:hypothetical protein
MIIGKINETIMIVGRQWDDKWENVWNNEMICGQKNLYS